MEDMINDPENSAFDFVAENDDILSEISPPPTLEMPENLICLVKSPDYFPDQIVSVNIAKFKGNI